MSSDYCTITEIVTKLVLDTQSYLETSEKSCFNKIIKMNSTSESSSSGSETSTSDSDNKNDLLIKDIRKKMKRLQKVKTPKKFLARKDSDSTDEDMLDDEVEEQKANLNLKYLKTKGELTIEDLEPVKQLNIRLDDSVKLVKMGQVISHVDDKLLVIKSIQIVDQQDQCKPLNEESILFDSNRRELGKIFEVFGPVQAPFYTIRFNSLKEIQNNSLNVENGAYIYYAHDMTEYTKFIFNIDELRRTKGSDASWNNDNEPPKDYIEYSDDEEEQLAKKNAKLKRLGSKLEKQSDENSDDESGRSIIQPQQNTSLRGGKRQAQSNFHRSNNNGLQSNKPMFYNKDTCPRPYFNDYSRQSHFSHSLPSSQPIHNQFIPSIQNQFLNDQYRMMLIQTAQPQSFMPNLHYNLQQPQNNQNYFHNKNQFQGQFNALQNNEPCFSRQFYSPPFNFFPNNERFQNNSISESNKNVKLEQLNNHKNDSDQHNPNFGVGMNQLFDKRNMVKKSF